MSYCVNCGVELEASLKECPLCHTPVMNPRELGKETPPSPYPVDKGQVEVVKRKDLGILITLVLSATSVTCLLLNLLVFDAYLWSLTVIGSCLCLFVFSFPAIFYVKAPIYLCLLADGASVAVNLFMISFLNDSNIWFWQIGLPIVVILTILAEFYPLLAKFHPINILSCALCIFIEIPVFCVALELLIRRFLDDSYRITWSAVVLTVCVIIDIALITILAKKRLRNEVRRRMHF